jgi:mono/diheme cytochrome c family protein
MKILSTLVIATVIVATGVIGFAYSGIIDVGANSPQGGFIEWLLDKTSDASIERRAAAIEVPNLDDETLVLAGVNDFNSMCIGCHGGPGIDPEAVGKGLNPAAPNLAESAAEMTPAELFWVTKYGIRMTGMPSWGATHGDDSIWPVVALLTKLPGLDELAYQELLESAAGHGHHAPDSSTDEHSHEEDGESIGDAAHAHSGAEETAAAEMVQTQAPEEHDHSTHEHD